MVWIPLALIGLLGVAALIIIYILKPKFQERQVSSTFVWQRSLKYARKKVPFEWLTGSLILIIQIIMLTLLAFMMTSPLFYRPSTAQEQIIILDGSAHMLASSDGQTRFDRAVADVYRMAGDASAATPMTIILGTSEPRVIVPRSGDTTSIRMLLRNVTEVRAGFGSINMDLTMEMVRTGLELNPDAEVIFFTGRSYENVDTGDIEVRNMCNNEWNAAIVHFDYTRPVAMGAFYFNARVASFNRDAALTVELFLDGELIGARRTVQANNNEEVPVNWTINRMSFTQARLEIVQIDGQYDLTDNFPYDDVFYIQASGAYLFDVHLVSPNPDFLRLALGATFLAARITVAHRTEDSLGTPTADLTLDDFHVETTGFHLYVFDHVMPTTQEQVPLDGVVWFINPTAAIPARGEFPGLNAPLPPAVGNRYIVPASVPEAASEQVRAAHDTIVGIIPTFNFSPTLPSNERPRLSVIRNIPIGDEDTRVFHPLLMADDLIALGVFFAPTSGQIVMYMPFSLHYSSLPLDILPFLLHGKMSFSLIPRSVGTVITVDTPLEIYSRPNVERIDVGRIDLPARHSFFDFTTAIAYRPRMPGRFSIESFVEGAEAPSVDYFFVRLATSESNFSLAGNTIIPPTVIGQGTARPLEAEAPVDILFWLAIALIAFINIEWFLNHRESA